MTLKRLLTTIFVAGAMITASAQYFMPAQAPNPLLFMGGFPGYQDTRFSVDIKHYFDGLDLRENNPTRAERIKTDATYGTLNLSKVYSACTNFTISSSVTPKLYTHMLNVTQTSGYAADKKALYNRIRPCVKFNEQPYSYPTETLASLKGSKSYPSAHSSTGWGVGLALAALMPHAQDTILARAYDYGQSRVWGGMHWQSDVDDARVITSACYARMITTANFFTHFYSAKQEIAPMLEESLGVVEPDYDAADYFAANNLPNPVAYLPAPPSGTESTPEQAYDLTRYLWGKKQRDGDDGLKAKFDTNSDLDVIINNFARAININITPELTPATYELLKCGTEIVQEGCKKAQEHYKRIRPYDYFKESAFTFENQQELSKVGSYPSTNSARAWMTALLLTAINPAQQDTILKVGFDMGESNVIAGINWQSDVEAGRLVAGAILSRMVSNPHMAEKIMAAYNEYLIESQQLITDLDDIPIDNEEKHEMPFFTIDGKVANKDSRGILVSKNKKIIR